MSGTKYDQHALAQHVTEGRADEVLRRSAAYNNTSNVAHPSFLRFVIIEVINDPSVIDAAKLSYYEHVLGVSNIKYAAVAPRNSIIARRVMGGDATASEKVMVLFPFFPPHLSLPTKPGEHVWGMFEHADAKVNELGYWMCRIVQPHFIEDVNYTHADRQFDRSFVPGLSDVFNGKDEPRYEFSNGAVDEKNGQRYVIADTASMPGDEKAYENLLQDTDASKQIKYEAVPRFRKRPSDIAIEGSNNTLIVLGTDRTGPISDYDDTENGKVPKPIDADVPGSGTGVIDLVVGRGQTASTKGTAVVNKLGNDELGKSKNELSPQEGDPDLRHDRSRVQVSQRTRVDTNYGLNVAIVSHTKKDPIKDAPDGDGAIVIKSDKLRFVSRQDVVVLVQGPVERDIDGRVKDTEADPEKCASVIIKANGDIVFTPSKTGLIKFGGDDADLSPLCTRVNNAGQGGKVVSQPIIDDMGGRSGMSDGLNGVFPTKVLLK